MHTEATQLMIYIHLSGYIKLYYLLEKMHYIDTLYIKMNSFSILPSRN